MQRTLTLKEANLLVQKINGLKSILRPMVQNIPGLIAERDEDAARSLERDSRIIGMHTEMLERELKNAKFIFPEAQDKKVKIGNIIFASFDGNQPSEFILSDFIERDDERIAISSSSPVGTAILGKELGIYKVTLPKRTIVVEIHKILPPEK